jgi:hypothetical protein
MEASDAEALARCDQELERIRSTHDEPAWLLVLAEQDWLMEKALILKQAHPVSH